MGQCPTFNFCFSCINDRPYTYSGPTRAIQAEILSKRDYAPAVGSNPELVEAGLNIILDMDNHAKAERHECRVLYIAREIEALGDAWFAAERDGCGNDPPADNQLRRLVRQYMIASIILRGAGGPHDQGGDVSRSVRPLLPWIHAQGRSGPAWMAAVRIVRGDIYNAIISRCLTLACEARPKAQVLANGCGWTLTADKQYVQWTEEYVADGERITIDCPLPSIPVEALRVILGGDSVQYDHRLEVAGWAARAEAELT